MHLLTIQMHEAKLRSGVLVLEFLTLHITWLEGNVYCTYTHWLYQSIELGSEISLLECLLVIVFPPNSFCVFGLLCSVFFCIVFSPSSSGLLLTSSMVASSQCFWICSRISVHRLVFTLKFTCHRELLKSMRKL